MHFLRNNWILCGLLIWSAIRLILMQKKKFTLFTLKLIIKRKQTLSIQKRKSNENKRIQKKYLNIGDCIGMQTNQLVAPVISSAIIAHPVELKLMLFYLCLNISLIWRINIHNSAFVCEKKIINNKSRYAHSGECAGAHSLTNTLFMLIKY